MDQGPKNILNYHQPTESEFWRWFRPKYAILERHWLLPWKIVAVLLLIYIPTQIISYRAYEARLHVLENQEKQEEIDNHIAVLKVTSLIKNLPSDQNRMEFIQEHLNQGRPLEKVSKAKYETHGFDPYPRYTKWEWKDPEGGSAWILTEPTSQLRVMQPNMNTTPYDLLNPFSFWIWAHYQYGYIQNKCQSLVVRFFGIIALIWIVTFVYRTNEQRLKSGLHLFFLSLTMAVLVFLPTDFQTTQWDRSPWVCGVAICLSGLACSFFLPRWKLLKYRWIWTCLFILGLMILSGAWYWSGKKVPHQIDLQTKIWLLDGDAVDRLIPASDRQPAYGPGSQTTFSHRTLTPATTAMVDNAVLEQLIAQSKPAAMMADNKTGTLSQTPFEWSRCLTAGVNAYDGYMHQGEFILTGSCDFGYGLDVKPGIWPRFRANNRLIYCEDGKLITHAPTYWEGELSMGSKKQVFLHDFLAGDGKRKCIMLVCEVKIDGK